MTRRFPASNSVPEQICTVGVGCRDKYLIEIVLVGDPPDVQAISSTLQPMLWVFYFDFPLSRSRTNFGPSAKGESRYDVCIGGGRGVMEKRM